MNFNGVSDGQTFNETASYTTVYASATTYKISLDFTATTSSNGGSSTSESSQSLIWILKNGTAIAIDEAGYNITGSLAGLSTTAFFAGFSEEIAFGNEVNLLTASSYFHSTGTSQVTIGSSTFKVTNYVANTLPETFPECGYGTTTLTSYALSVGTPSGSSYPLVTSLTLSGSTTDNGTTTSINVEILLTSITVA